MSTEQLDQAITIKEAADALRVVELTVKRLIDRGSLPSFRVGRARRIWRKDLIEFCRRSLEAEKAQKESVADTLRAKDHG
jgi:excisionase family DNA binding protein